MADQGVGKHGAIRRTQLLDVSFTPQVSAVMVFDTLHQILITHSGTLASWFFALRLTRTVYTYVIIYFGDYAQLNSLVWYVFPTNVYAHASQPLTVGVLL